jgi:Zn-dependent membrane protease YugP
VSSYAPTAFLRGALAAVLLVSGLKLVNVPTLWIGIVLLACVVGLGTAWLYIRASGRTLREISGETTAQILAGAHRDFADEPALQTAGSLSEA